MADLVVLDFDGSETADTVLTKLRALKKQELIDLKFKVASYIQANRNE